MSDCPPGCRVNFNKTGIALNTKYCLTIVLRGAVEINEETAEVIISNIAKAIE